MALSDYYHIMFRTPPSDFHDSVIPNVYGGDHAESPLLCCPYSLGEQKGITGRLCENRLNGEYEIIWAKRGSTRIESGCRSESFGKGTILIIPPFTAHTIISDRNDPHHHIWCHFQIEPVWLRPGIDRLFGRNQFALFAGTGQGEELFDRLLEEGYARREGYLSVIGAELTKLIITLLRQQSWNPSAENIPSRDETRALRICLRLIEENVGAGYSAGRLSEDSGFSSSWILKLFKGYLGISPSRHIMKCRLRQAHALLVLEKKSVKETAWELNFSSPYHFSRIFKEYYGTSPSKWMNLSSD